MGRSIRNKKKTKRGISVAAGSNVTVTENNGVYTVNSSVLTSWSEDLNGNLLPAKNADYDIGSPERKVQHLYLSQNSLYMGSGTDEGTPISLDVNGDLTVGETKLIKEDADGKLPSDKLPANVASQADLDTLQNEVDELTTTIDTKASQADLDTAETNITNLNSVVLRSEYALAGAGGVKNFTSSLNSTSLLETHGALSNLFNNVLYASYNPELIVLISSGDPWSVGIEFSTAQVVTKYRIWGRHDGGTYTIQNPNAWQLRGALDRSTYAAGNPTTYTVLHEETNAASSFSTYNTSGSVPASDNPSYANEYNLSTVGSYKYYVFHFTENGGHLKDNGDSYITMSELGLYGGDLSNLQTDLDTAETNITNLNSVVLSSEYALAGAGGTETFTASSPSGSNGVSYAHDNIIRTDQYQKYFGSDEATVSLVYEFSSPQIVTNYKICPRSDSPYNDENWKTWEFRAAVDSTEYNNGNSILLDSQNFNSLSDWGNTSFSFTSDVTASDHLNLFKTFQLSKIGAYKYYRFNVTASFDPSNHKKVSEVALYGGGLSNKKLQTDVDALERGTPLNLMDTEVWTTQSGTLSDFGGYTLYETTVGENVMDSGEGPFGYIEQLWKCDDLDTSSDAEGGWDYTINGISDKFGYLSVVYVKVLHNSSGRFLHGPGTYHSASHTTLNLNGNTLSFPYFTDNVSLSTLELNVWYVSVGVIFPYNSSGYTSGSTKGGLYKVSTGEKVANYTTYMMKQNSTSQQHRSYMIWSSVVDTELYFARPGFYKINGTEPSIHDLCANTSLGTFTGSTINDNRTVKEALQDMETAVEGKSTVSAGGSGGSTMNNITIDGTAYQLVVGILNSPPYIRLSFLSGSYSISISSGGSFIADIAYSHSAQSADNIFTVSGIHKNEITVPQGVYLLNQTLHFDVTRLSAASYLELIPKLGNTTLYIVGKKIQFTDKDFISAQTIFQVTPIDGATLYLEMRAEGNFALSQIQYGNVANIIKIG